MATISEMLHSLAEDRAEVEDFNAAPENYMENYGLNSSDQQIVLDYIQENPHEPDQFIEQYAPDLIGNPTALLIIC
jgi:hypothetical protein